MVFGGTQMGLWFMCERQKCLWSMEWVWSNTDGFDFYVPVEAAMVLGCVQSSLVLEVSSLLRLDSRSLRAPWAEAWLLRMLAVAWAMVSIALW